MKARAGRWLLALVLALSMLGSLRALDAANVRASRDEKLYFPSGRFLVESSLGFREAMADWLWFRFIQYYGAFKNGDNDLRYLDLMIRGINRLDPRFTQAYYLTSFIYWTDFGEIDRAFDVLRRGILNNPDNAGLRFQIGFMHYVTESDYLRAARWFEIAAECSDATDRESRFAAFARYRAGDERVSLALWKDLLEKSSNPQMQDLAATMVEKLVRSIRIRQIYGEGFIGPIPELLP